MNDFTNDIRDLAKDFSQNILVTAAMAVAGYTVGSITLPMLAAGIVAYIATKKSESLNVEKKTKTLTAFFEQSKDEIIKLLKVNQNTQLTQLEKELNIDIRQKGIQEVMSLILEKVETSDDWLEEISQKVGLTKEEVESVNSKLDGISQDIARIEDKVDSVSYNLLGMQAALNCVIHSNGQDSSRILPRVFASSFSIKVVTGYNGHDDFDLTINRIIEDIFSDKISQALTNLNILAQDQKISQSIPAKAWVCILRGYALLLAGDIAGEDDFNQACALWNNKIDSLGAKLICAHIERLRGNNERSIEYVSELIASPEKEYAIEAKCLWIELVNKDITGIEESISVEERKCPTILRAFANRYFEIEQYKLAEKYIRESIALSTTSKSLGNCGYLSDILFAKKLGKYIFAGFSKPYILKDSWEEYNEILAGYIEEYSIQKDFACDIKKSQLLYKILHTHFVVGNQAESLGYIEKILKCSKIDSHVLEFIIEVLIKFERYQKAIDILDKCMKISSSRDLVFRNKYIELLLFLDRQEEALILLWDNLELLTSEETLCDTHSVLSLGNILHKSADKKNYDKLLKSQLEEGRTISYNVLLARERIAESNEESSALLDEIIAGLPQDILFRRLVICEIAPLLEQNAETTKLLSLLDEIVFKDELTNLGRKYFNLAVEAKDLERVSAFCSELRRNGYFDWELINNEIQFTRQFGHLTTRRLIETMIDQPALNSHRNELILWRAITLLESGRITAEDFVSYPEVRETENSYPWGNVPIVLTRLGKWQDAIKYAYEMHMKYPGVEEIIKIFNNLMFFPDKNFNLPTSDTVAVDYAVLYHVEGESQDRFLIIEQSPYAKKIDFEYSPADDFVEDIMGKKVGDKFIVGDIIRKQCIIKEIKHKILFKFHRYLEEGKGMPDGFRGAINTPMRPDGSLDFQELKEYLNNVDEQHSTLSTAAQHVYLEKLPSIYVFSSFSNLSLAQTIIFLCRQDKMCINAAIGVDSERKESSKFFKEAESIILSPLTLELLVAFSAIMNIDAVEILRNSSKRFTVSEYTVSDFIAQEDHYSTERIQLINNEPRIVANKYFYKIHENYCILVDFLEDASLVTVVPGSLNKSNFSKENLNIKGALGRALFHTLMLATQNPSMLLWEDDANTVKLCNNSFPQEINVQKRIFTQGVFFQLVNDKIIDDKIADKACIFLILLNVDFTRITSTALFEIFTNAEYKDLIPRVMKSIENSEINSTIEVTSIAIAILLKRSTNIRRTIDHSIIPLCDQCLSRDASMLKELLLNVFILLRPDRQAVKNMKRIIKRQYSALFRPYELSNLGRDIE